MRNLFVAILGILLFSCQEEVNLPLASLDEDIPVIEASWTDVNFYNEVKISKAQNYFDTTNRPYIEDAEVYILERSSQRRINFFFFPQTASFRPVNPQEVARVGEAYELHVIWQENEFVANGLMLAPPIVDSLTYAFQPKRLFRDEGYYIKVYGQIPFEDNNYYRIRIIENDTLKNDRGDYLLFDDSFGLSFFEEGLELGYAFKARDEVRLELYRLNQDAYNYLNQLVSLLFSDGGLFSPPPQNPDTNIRVLKGGTDVLGYFMVSPVLTHSLKIEEKE